jgi:hypothetical protein
MQCTHNEEEMLRRNMAETVLPYQRPRHLALLVSEGPGRIGCTLLRHDGVAGLLKLGARRGHAACMRLALQLSQQVLQSLASADELVPTVHDLVAVEAPPLPTLCSSRTAFNRLGRSGSEGCGGGVGGMKALIKEATSACSRGCCFLLSENINSSISH